LTEEALRCVPAEKLLAGVKADWSGMALSFDPNGSEILRAVAHCLCNGAKVLAKQRGMQREGGWLLLAFVTLSVGYSLRELEEQAEAGAIEELLR